jgi:hypothetical protein
VPIDWRTNTGTTTISTVFCDADMFWTLPQITCHASMPTVALFSSNLVCWACSGVAVYSRTHTGAWETLAQLDARGLPPTRLLTVADGSLLAYSGAVLPRLCVCVCVCVREREREGGRERQRREGERQRERKRGSPVSLPSDLHWCFSGVRYTVCPLADPTLCNVYVHTNACVMFTPCPCKISCR